MLAQEGGGPAQDASARGAAHPGPAGERAPRRSDGAIDVALTRVVDLAQRLAGRRIEADEALARVGRRPPAIDEQRLQFQLHIRPPLPISAWMRFLD